MDEEVTQVIRQTIDYIVGNHDIPHSIRALKLYKNNLIGNDNTTGISISLDGHMMYPNYVSPHDKHVKIPEDTIFAPKDEIVNMINTEIIFLKLSNE